MFPLTDRPGWQAAGEISLLTRPAWEQTLAHLARSDEENQCNECGFHRPLPAGDLLLPIGVLVF